jgi:hypothetical protein
MTRDEVRRPVTDVEIHAGAAGALDLVVDGARHDVTRGQGAPLVIARHELLTVLVDQPRSFAAHRLGDEERALLRMIEAGRVELDELHVRNRRPRTPGHRHTVSRRDHRDSSCTRYTRPQPPVARMTRSLRKV